ncbi:SDR family NAD(P)-dependent oxidoreductase [Komagataeibacter medellinensis]|uniref:SDR family NAD(P)-dependent oxidoreductase n=1 Tax=Komagataeibacter medellinensis TaxID=1177712 RepID=UPI00059CA952|nr:SDR family NAD(P)-dependent oxidoreductase [Komagataeibacter medellinensis]
MRLLNKVAIVTGASSGIGPATALLFAQEGSAIVAVNVTEDGAHERATRRGASFVLPSPDPTHTDAMGKWHPAAGLAAGAQTDQERL